MANQDVRVSALQSARTLSTDDLALATVVDELSETGYTSKKITEGAKASQYLEAFTFANLNTSAKTIVGAINEAATAGGADEFIIHMTDTTVTETAADIIDAFDGGSEIWLESQITGETIKARLPLLAYISDSSQLALRFSGITYANNRYRYCDVQMLRSPEQIVGRQAINVTFAVIDDATTSASSVWSSQKTAAELADKAEIDDTAVSSSTAWSSSQIVSLLPTESASGAVASFETPLTLPLVSHNVTIEPVQSGTGDPSPSNVRPISGWSEMNVTKLANLTSPSDLEQGTFNSSNGQLQPSTTRLRMTSSKQIGAGSYTIDATGADDVVVYVYDLNGSWISAESVVNWQSLPYTFTLTGSRLVNFALRHSDNSTITTDEVTACLFYANSSKGTYNLALGQTVYGGTGDVINGVVESTFSNLTSFSTGWYIQGDSIDGGKVYAHSLSNKKTPNADGICDTLKTNNITSWSRTTKNTINFGHGQQLVFACVDGVTTETEMNAYMANVNFIYLLATPVEVTLTPEHISTLKGVNNIWADTGDTAVEYKQDIQTYIDSRLSSGTRSLSLAKAPVETKEETKQEEQEGDENVNR